MKRFRRIYLLSYALIFSVSLGLFISTYTLLPSQAVGNYDDISNAICHQTSRNKFGLEVSCQSPTPEIVGKIWTANNYALAMTTVAPVVTFYATWVIERQNPAGDKIVITPWKSIKSAFFILLCCSPHLIALGLVLHWVATKFRLIKTR